MEKQILQNLSKKNRIDNLQAMAHSVEETTYYKQLSPEELEVRQEKFIANTMKMNDLETKKKAFVESVKSEQKPLSVENTDLLQSLKTKTEKVEGVLYHIDDQDEGMMYSYDEDGNFISSRRLRPDEKQSSIFKIAK
jgi:hypothetical protein